MERITGSLPCLLLSVAFPSFVLVAQSTPNKPLAGYTQIVVEKFVVRLTCPPKTGPVEM
jgi:hypothetical protein